MEFELCGEIFELQHSETQGVCQTYYSMLAIVATCEDICGQTFVDIWTAVSVFPQIQIRYGYQVPKTPFKTNN